MKRKDKPTLNPFRKTLPVIIPPSNLKDPENAHEHKDIPYNQRKQNNNPQECP